MVKPALMAARAALLAVFVVGWFASQSFLAQFQVLDDGEALGDGIHNVLLPVTNYFHANPLVADKVLIASSACIDVFATLMMLLSVFGRTMRPVVGIVFVFIMRQSCQSLVTLPSPKKVFWRDPGVPSLLVTYDTPNDFFFSGHTAIAVVCAVELGRMFGRKGQVVRACFAAFEIFVVLALQAHWTMDVFTGFVAARYATLIAPRFIGFLERVTPAALVDDAEPQPSSVKAAAARRPSRSPKRKAK